MTDEIRRKLDMARRVRQFLAAPPSAPPLMPVLVDRFLGELDRAEQFRRLVWRAEGRRLAALDRRAAAARALNQFLGWLVRGARFAARETGPAALRLSRPRRVGAHADYLNQVQVLLQAVEAHPAELERTGVSSALVPEVWRQYQEYRDALAERDRSVLDRVGATAGLSAAVAGIMESVEQLDGVLAYAYRHDPGVAAAWRSARRIHWPGRYHPHPRRTGVAVSS